MEEHCTLILVVLLSPYSHLSSSPAGVFGHLVSIVRRKWAGERCRESTKYFCSKQFETDKFPVQKARY